MANFDYRNEIESNDDTLLSSNKSKYSKAEKRAHHNALELKRRDDLKRKFLETIFLLTRCKES